MGAEDNRYNNVKIIFSLISLFLMLPPLLNGDSGYYRTLFIFLINRVIDMVYRKPGDNLQFFVIWILINQWIGVVACAVAFCSLVPDFAAVFAKHSSTVNLILFTSAVSCVLRELIELIIISIQEKLVKQKIKNDLTKLKGDI